MDTMHTLWEYTDEEGQEKFGSNFQNSTWFTRAHYFGASQQDADHIHEGLGFLLNHHKMSNMFEKAMQAVNPSVTLPYWDYTIENAAGQSVFESYAFTEETFGTVTAPDDDWTYAGQSMNDARISNGRWKDLKSELNYFHPDLVAGYGYLRAPWNMNPSPYILRFASDSQFPGCSDFAEWASRDEVNSFMKYSPGPPHASIHGNIGGVYGCDKLDALLVDSGWVNEGTSRDLCSQWGFKLKNLYRQNYIIPYSYDSKQCKVIKNHLEDSICGFSCVDDNLDTMIDAMKDMMESHFDEDFPDANWEKIQEFICSGDAWQVFYGDHLESASAADPSFWPVHPASERFLQARLAAAPLTGEWYSDYQSDWVWGRPECVLTEETGSPYKQYDSQCCLGHFENDGFLDFRSNGGDKHSTFGLSNKEQLAATYPTAGTYDLNYIYDSFKWSHCATLTCTHSTCDIDAVLLDIYNTNQETTDPSVFSSEEEDDDDRHDDDEEDDDDAIAFENYN